MKTNTLDIGRIRAFEQHLYEEERIHVIYEGL